MANTIVRNSRLRYADFVEVDGVEFFDTLDLPDIPEQVDDIIHQVAGGERYDLLAHKFYGDSVLWWVIAAVNDIELPPFGLHVGAIIRIPSPNFVNQRLFNGSQR